MAQQTIVTRTAYQRAIDQLAGAAARMTDKDATEDLIRTAKALAFIALRRSGFSTVAARKLQDGLAEHMLANLV